MQVFEVAYWVVLGINNRSRSLDQYLSVQLQFEMEEVIANTHREPAYIAKQENVSQVSTMCMKVHLASL